MSKRYLIDKYNLIKSNTDLNLISTYKEHSDFNELLHNKFTYELILM